VIYTSTILYALGKMRGHVDAVADFKHWANQTDADWSAADGPPVIGHAAARVFHRLRHLDDLDTRIDVGGTCLSKARCRALHGALYSKADVWVSVDDDVEADTECLESMLTVARATRGVCIAPCLTRRFDRDMVNVFSLGPGEALHDVPSLRVLWGGFGLVAIHREAFELVARNSDRWQDDDREWKPAAFLDILSQHGAWLDDDKAFFFRLPRSVRVSALLVGRTTHAGRELNCGDIMTMDRFDTPGARSTVPL